MWVDGPPLQELSAYQRDALVTVAYLDNPSVRDVAKALDRQHEWTRQSLNELRDSGLVDRQVGEDDRRERTHSLTADGREMATAHAEWMTDSLKRGAREGVEADE